MKLKINKWEFDVTDQDWILDNGACYQCMTLKHSVYEQSIRESRMQVTKMSKKQFKQLVKDGILYEVTNSPQNERYKDCRVWKFKIDAYTERGYKNRTEYLKSLAEDYGVGAVVGVLAETLGPSEDFDGLISALEDMEDFGL